MRDIAQCLRSMYLAKATRDSSVGDGVDSSFTMNSKFSNLSLWQPCLEFSPILNNVFERLVLCLKMKRASCSVVSVDSQLNTITTS